jgi:hypothetical protein
MDKCGEHRKNTDRSHQHDGVYDGMAQAASPRPRHGQQRFGHGPGHLRLLDGPWAPAMRLEGIGLTMRERRLPSPKLGPLVGSDEFVTEEPSTERTRRGGCDNPGQAVRRRLAEEPEQTGLGVRTIPPGRLRMFATHRRASARLPLCVPCYCRALLASVLCSA